MLSCYLTLKMRLSALFGRVCILTFSLGWFSSLKLNLEIFGQWPINWMTNGYKSWNFFCVSLFCKCSDCIWLWGCNSRFTICSWIFCSIMLEVFFSSTTNYVLWWVQQFIYVWGTQDWGNMYSSPYFTRLYNNGGLNSMLCA